MPYSVALPRVLHLWVGVLIAGISGVFFWLTVEPAEPWVRLAQVGLVGGYVLAILLIARYRYTLFLLAMLITMTGWLLDIAQEPFIVATWAIYRATFLTRHRRFFLPAIAIVAALLTIALIVSGAPSSQVLLLQVLMSLTLLFGGWLFGAQGRAEAEQRAQISRARERNQILEERARVSRDLHDVLSHTLSRIGIQAGVVAELEGDDDGRAVATLRGIEIASRDALKKVRDVIANVRENTTTGVALTDIEQLLDESRDAGIDIVAQLDMPPGDAGPSGPELYYVIQEIITNIGKHATGSAGALLLEHRDATVRVHAENRHTTSCDLAEDGPGEGLGIIGIRERVAALGGSCCIHSTDGVFRIDIVVPMTASPIASAAASTPPAASGPSAAQQPNKTPGGTPA